MAFTGQPVFYLFCFFYGIWAMAFFHNSLVSIVLFRARDSKFSNFLKIVFNISGLTRAVISITGLLTPDHTTESDCQVESYFLNLANTFFRISLSTFLLWRIRQIENKGKEQILGLTLLLAATVLELIRALSWIFHSQVLTNGLAVCGSPQSQTNRSIQWSYLAIDFFIDLYVSVRLVHILSKANINAKFVAANMQRPHKRTLFTAVMYWNFLRLIICIFYHIITALQAQVNNSNGHSKINQNVLVGLFTFAYVSLSYVITADAEIVRKIEGRDSNQGKGMSGSSGTGKSYKSSSSPRGQTSTISSADYTTSSPSYKEATANTPRSPDSDTKFVATMGRVSFFEWAKSAVGGKNSGENVEVEVEDSIEEVRQDVTANSDPELGLVGSNENRRDSDVSGATAVTESITTSANDNEKKHDPAP